MVESASSAIYPRRIKFLACYIFASDMLLLLRNVFLLWLVDFEVQSSVLIREA